mgnify:CR=1 FL=1
MEKNVLNTDLTGKVAVVTGASGTLCCHFFQGAGPGGRKGGAAGPQHG